MRYPLGYRSLVDPYIFFSMLLFLVLLMTDFLPTLLTPISIIETAMVSLRKWKTFSPSYFYLALFSMEHGNDSIYKLL